MEAKFELEVKQLSAHPKHITPEQAAVHATQAETVEPPCEAGNAQVVNDLVREVSTNQALQNQNPFHPGTSTQPTGGDNITDPSNTSQTC